MNKGIMLFGACAGFAIGSMAAGYAQSLGAHWVLQIGIALAFAAGGAFSAKKLFAV